MKKYLFGAAAALLIALPLSASIRPQEGKFGLKGEWIYFYPAIEDTYFAMSGIPVSDDVALAQGEKQNNLFNYTSGYRLEGIYSFNCVNDLRVRWTQLLKKSHTTSVVGDAVFFTELPPLMTPNGSTEEDTIFVDFGDSAISDISMEYYAAEAMLGQLIYDCSPFTMEFEIGIQYAHFKYNENVTYHSPTVVDDFIDPIPELSQFVSFNDTFNGVGPEMGFDADYALYNSDCCCPGTLYLTSSLRGALLIADSKAKFFASQTNLSATSPLTSIVYDVQDKKSWRVVPWWDMKLGFNYTSCFDCFTLSVEAGYEAGSYINAISKERFASSSLPGYSFNQFQDFTYHGPYVSAEVMF